VNPIIQRLLRATPEERISILGALAPEELAVVYRQLDILEKSPQRRWYCQREMCNGNPHAGFHWCEHPIDGAHKPFCKHARTPQRPPATDPENPWMVWMFMGGRGTGKTRSGAEWVLDLVWNQGYKRIALIGRTPADVRDVMIHGDSGIMNCSDPHPKPLHEPTKRQLLFANGAECFTYSAAAPDQLRGPQHDAAWGDEIAAWTDANKGDALDTAYNNLMLGMRLGERPMALFTTTPKRVRIVKEILERRTTTITNGTTYDNLDNLAGSFRESVLQAYEGTRIGQQELMGLMMTDVEGAMWTLDMIDQYRGRYATEEAVVA